MLTKCIRTLIFLFVIGEMKKSATGFPFRRTKLMCGRQKQGRREGKIVGGFVAAEGEFPWMVSFKSKHGHFCGGTVISDKYLMSAAHCFHHNEYLEYNKDGSVNLKSVNVTLGEYSLKKKDEGTEVLMNLKKIHLHPNYNPVSKQNDIALIKITKSISVAPNIVPACLPGNSDNAMWETNTKATVLGWGKTTHDQDYYDWVREMDALRRVDVSIWDKDACIDSYKGFPKFPSSSFLCAGHQGKESCTGDSGGPLLRLDDNKRWVVIGVVANGNKCGHLGRPGIYTKVSDFLKWIESYTR